ncbi:MAG TPA: VOC family protein [Bacillales bacterium]|nr:VOC family protein [Bacillales bacterium]
MSFVKRIDTVFVPVTNLKKSEKWYLELLPFKVTFRSSDGKYVGFRFRDHHPYQTGLCIYKAEKMEKPGHMTFNFFTEDVDGFHNFLKEREVEVTEIHEDDGMRFFEFYDPDGNEIGAVTFPE